ncbi:MAG TPA: GntR family transcriptional regulator [Bauldia sp.]|nr:GntR family transcriptional regulator [Bauldia sp.]
MVSLNRATLAEQAYEELQDRIVSGALPAGHRLRADELADALAISQTPVKEALALLERDGLVEAASRRGSVVRRFTIDDVVEIYDARMLLEISAVETGFREGNATVEFAEALGEIFRQQMVFVEQQSEDALFHAIRLDREFHEKIVSLWHSHLIAGWHRVVLRQTQTIRNYPLFRYDVTRTRREHSAIVEAFKAGSGRSAADALKTHLMASRDEFLSRPPEELPIRA